MWGWVGVRAEVYHNTFYIKDRVIKKEKIESSMKILMNNSRESEINKSREKDVESMFKRELEKESCSHNNLMTLLDDLKFHAFCSLEE